MGKDFSAWDVNDSEEIRRRRDQAETYHHIQAGAEKDIRGVMNWGAGTIWKSISILILLSGIKDFDVTVTTCSTTSAFWVANWPHISGALRGLITVLVPMIVLKILFFVAFIATSGDELPSPHEFWRKRKAE